MAESVAMTAQERTKEQLGSRAALEPPVPERLLTEQCVVVLVVLVAHRRT